MFSDKQQLHILTTINRLIIKESAHLDWLKQNNAPVRFLHYSSHQLEDLKMRLKEYKEYFEKEKPKEERSYFDDMEKWESEFECNECGEYEQKKFTYNRTAANGEEWICKCGKDNLFNEKPNEDNY